jgi:broad-specificity NMP kinase
MKTIYLISGPLGVGKSTVSKALHKKIAGSALLVGDDLYNLEEDNDLEWEEKLQEGWKRVLAATEKMLKDNEVVIIDFVVEDELPWFMNSLSSYDLQFKYVVLLADKETILERLEKRGELKYKDRSMVLLEQLSKDTFNKGFILDTTDKEVDSIATEILNTAHFTLA